MLVLKWKERTFIEKVDSRCFCWFPAAILVHQNGTPIWRLPTKVYKGPWNVSANTSETVCHKDLAETCTNCLYISLLLLFIFLTSFNFFFCSVTVKTIKKVRKLVPRFFANCSIHWRSNKNGVNPDRRGCCYPPADYWFQAIMEIITERKSQWSNW